LTELAAVLLAHADPAHLRRLVAALPDVPVFLHCDVKTNRPVFQRMVATLPPNVRLCERLPTNRDSWSLVDAELVGLRDAVRQTAARHIAVLTGADYPLVSVQQLVTDLAAWDGHSYLWNVPMPYSRWNNARHADGGLWRLQHRYLTRHGQLVYWRKVPLRWPIKRQLPAGITLRASSQWKIYAREHAEILLRIVDTRPDLVRFWSSTLLPEETFVASVLASPAVVGSLAIPPCRAQAWYVDWSPPDAHHPRWLTGSDFERLSQARRAAPISPEAAFAANGDEEKPHRKLFARKFSSEIDIRILDRIDHELRT
jgi:Core-2/I-Branching enzyme